MPPFLPKTFCKINVSFLKTPDSLSLQCCSVVPPPALLISVTFIKVLVEGLSWLQLDIDHAILKMSPHPIIQGFFNSSNRKNCKNQKTKHLQDRINEPN